jgi:hypothetical protein
MMDARSTNSTVTFAHPFRIAGYETELPAGDYEMVAEEDRLQGLSFQADRRSRTFLLIHGAPGGWGARDPEVALARDQATSEQA